MKKNEYLNNQTFERIIHAFQALKKKKERCKLMLGDFHQTYARRKEIDATALKDESYLNLENEYKESCEQFEKYQQELTHAFYILSENLSTYYLNRFPGYSGMDIDDATQEAVLICFEKIDRFDPSKGMAFNYMTTCIINHFRQIYRSNRNYGELKKKYFNYLQDSLESVFFRNGRERTISE